MTYPVYIIASYGSLHGKFDNENVLLADYGYSVDYNYLGSNQIALINQRAAWCVNGAVEASGDGTSWDTAFKTLQEALSVRAR